MGRKATAVKDFRTLLEAGVVGGLSDGELLERFIARRDEAVFGAIVDRYGPMVWGVCRRALRDHHDAEDAFQAVFLVLARKADSVRPREKVGDWLHGVARRTAAKARARAARRRAREKQVSDLPEPEAARDDPREDLGPLLDRELGRLPEKYRILVVLCDLEGRTLRQAADQLGWPIGTVSGRLSRARTMLAERLARRGLAPAAAIATLSSQGAASACAPPALIASTTKAAILFAAGRRAADVASTWAAELTEGALKAMMTTKLKIASAAVILAALGVAGAVSAGPGRPAEALRPPQAEAPAQAGEPRRQTLDPKEEMKKLEGTWAVTDIVEQGVQPTAEQKAEGLGRMVIKDGRMTFQPPPSLAGAVTWSVAFDLDPSKTPPLIGMAVLDEKQEEVPGLPLLIGIYELKGDALRISFGFDRPEGFEPTPGVKQNLFVLKWARW